MNTNRLKGEEREEKEEREEREEREKAWNQG